MSTPPKAPPSTWTETGALAQASNVDDWLAIQGDGSILVTSGKVELGTGVRTALAQIVAEELDVPFESIRMVMGDTARTPNEGYTAGSKTIQFGGVSLRMAAAAARRALLQLAASRLGTAVDELTVQNGIVSVIGRPERRVSYADLAGGRRLNRTIGTDIEPKNVTAHGVVGSSIQRVDLPPKITGKPSFIHDLRLPGMLHGRVVRPPAPDSTLVSVDEASAGTARVVRIGSFLGVVAESEEDAIRGARSLKVRWQPGPPLPRLEEIFEHIRNGESVDREIVGNGSVEGAMPDAAVRHSARYHHPFQAHASIGPSCAVAEVTPRGVTVWCSTQGPYPLRGALAELFALPAELVRVVHMEGAGCFGHNGADDVAADAAILARAVGKPVRVQWSRSDEFAWEPYGPAMVTEMRGGMDEAGRIVAWEHITWSPSHSSRPRAGEDLLAARLASGRPAKAPTLFVGGDRNAPVNYEIANQHVLMRWLPRSPLRASSMRSLGGFANAFANESFFDELAAAAGADPVQLRLAHLSDERALTVIREAAARAGWGEPLPPDEGRGIAYAQYENSEAYVATVAHVAVDRSTGRIIPKRIVVAHDCGLVVNPNGLENQIEGNIIQGLSRTLKERVTWEHSEITSRDWGSYPILTFSEIPEIEIALVNRPTCKPVGAGEPATITVAPAVANAVFAATGARVRELPLTAERVRSAL